MALYYIVWGVYVAVFVTWKSQNRTRSFIGYDGPDGYL
jgi:hypothetical protein